MFISALIQKSWPLETSLMSLSLYMDKPDVVRPYSGIVLSRERNMYDYQKLMLHEKNKDDASSLMFPKQS